MAPHGSNFLCAELHIHHRKNLLGMVLRSADNGAVTEPVASDARELRRCNAAPLAIFAPRQQFRNR
jgi:hypothetical protein